MSHEFDLYDSGAWLKRMRCHDLWPSMENNGAALVWLGCDRAVFVRSIWPAVAEHEAYYRHIVSASKLLPFHNCILTTWL